MLGYKKALASKQVELEKQVTGLRDSVAHLRQENKTSVEVLSKELRTEISNLHQYFKSLDESLKAQITSVAKVSEAFGRSSDLEAINIMETFQTFTDRLNRVEEAVNHFTVTVYETPAANPPTGPIPAGVAENASSDNPSQPRRRRGRPRKSESLPHAHSGTHSAAEA